MIAIGFIYTVIFWFMAVYALTEFEMHVGVLRPWMRQLYAFVSFLAGVALTVLVTRHRR